MIEGCPETLEGVPAAFLSIIVPHTVGVAVAERSACPQLLTGRVHPFEHLWPQKF